MSLIELEPGSEVSAENLNNNFDYLEDLVVNATISFDGRIASANNNISNITSNMATIQGAITDLETDLETTAGSKANLNLSNINASGKAKILDCIAPNYGAGYSISSGWTSPKAGWVYFGGSADRTSSVYIGGVYFEISYDSGDGQSSGNIFMFIGKGVAVTSFSNIREARFYPCKGN